MLALPQKKQVYRPGLFVPGYTQNYLDQITAADRAAGVYFGLSRGIVNGISTYIRGLIIAQMLGISNNVISQAASTIKAHCILAGANTLSGALVPVVGPAPTNFNFVSGDYNRRSLKSNGTKNLGSGRNNNEDPQDNKHISVYIATPSTIIGTLIGGRVTDVGSSQIVSVSTGGNMRVNSTLFPILGASHFQAGLTGVSRTASNALNFIYNTGTTATESRPSETPANAEILIFNRFAGPGADAALSAYTIGEAVNFAILRSLQDRLFATLAAVIP